MAALAGWLFRRICTTVQSNRAIAGRVFAESSALLLIVDPRDFWHVINLCRFEAGELDDWIPGLRLPDDASFFDLPPWTPEVRKPASLRRERS